MKKNIYILIIFMCMAEWTSAQKVLTFQEAVRIAMENNYQIQISRNNAEIAENNVNIGNAGLLPKLDLVTASNYQNTDYANTALDNSEFSTSTANAQLTYTLFDGFGNVYKFEKLKTQGQAGELQARYQIENTLYNVSSAYYNTALTFENWQLTRDLLEISRQRLERARKKADYGQSNTLEVLSAQVDLNADSVEALRARLQFNETRRNLNVLLNKPVEEFYQVDSTVAFHLDLNYEELKQRAKNENASYLLEKNMLKQTRLDLNSAWSASFPKLDLQGSYGYSQTADKLQYQLNNPDKVLRGGATLTFNVFNGFKTRIQQQNARLNYENQKLYEQEASLALDKEISNSWESFNNSKLILEMAAKNLQAAELNFKRTSELYNLGQATMTQFREAQLNLFRAKYSITYAKFSARLDEIDLLRITGSLLGNDAWQEAEKEIE